MKTLVKIAALTSFAALPLTASAGTVPLSGVDATGYAALTGFNNEYGKPYTGTGKGFKYPYYWNPKGCDGGTGCWYVIAAEKLSADSFYPQESQYEVLGKDVTDADFNKFSVGSITYADSAVAATGTSVIGVNDITLNINAPGFDPIDKSRNVNNEFAYRLKISASNITGKGLTFVDGKLTSIDLGADLNVGIEFMNNSFLKFNPGFSQVNAFSIVGNKLAFNFDETKQQGSPLGVIADPRLIINRAGTIDAVHVNEVPVPAAVWLFGSALLGLAAKKRR